MALTEASAFKDGSINTADIADNAVTTAKIATDAVTTSKIANANITGAKLAQSSVGTGMIVDGAVTQAKINSAVIFTPVGTVITYAGSTAPTGYLKANGDTIPDGSGTVQGITADFSALYAVVGATLPDLRGEFIRGFDDGKGTDSGRAIRSSQTDQNKQHAHGATSTFSGGNHDHQYNISHVTTSSVQARIIGTSDNRMSLIDTTNHGSLHGTTGSRSASGTVSTSIANDGGTEVRPRNVALLMCIKF